MVCGFDPIYHSTSIILELLAIISRMHLSFYLFIAPLEQDAHLLPLGTQARQWRPTMALLNVCGIYEEPRMTKASIGRRPKMWLSPEHEVVKGALTKVRLVPGIKC